MSIRTVPVRRAVPIATVPIRDMPVPRAIPNLCDMPIRRRMSIRRHMSVRRGKPNLRSMSVLQTK
jgi:hypothetical protein